MEADPGKTFPRPASEFIILHGGAEDRLRLSGPAVEFKIVPKVVVASSEEKGIYVGVADAIRELNSWTDSKGVRQVGHPFCLYYNTPTETPAQELKSQGCIPISRVLDGEGKFRVKELAETQEAEMHHEDSSDQFAMTFGAFLKSLLKDEYRLLGPAREYHTTLSDVTGSAADFLIQRPIGNR